MNTSKPPKDLTNVPFIHENSLSMAGLSGAGSNRTAAPQPNSIYRAVLSAFDDEGGYGVYN